MTANTPEPGDGAPLSDDARGAGEAPVSADTRLAAIRARCEAATPGPWFIDDRDRQRIGSRLIEVEDVPGVHVSALGDLFANSLLSNDAAFIAHAREDVPYLLALVARLRAVEAAARRLADVSDYSHQRKVLLAALGSLDPTPQAEAPRASRATRSDARAHTDTEA